MSKTALSFLSLLAMPLALCAPTAVKVIDLSWSNPTIAFLEAHLEEMERNTPLDGVTIFVIGKKEDVDGKPYGPDNGNAWNRRPWKYEQLQDEIQRYKALKFNKFKDNFYYLTTNEVDFDWTHDDDWRNVANNFGIAARVAREMGLKGLLVDIEEYGKKYWNYGDDVHPKNMDFSDLCKYVQQRGRQWGQAIFDAYPNIILFMPMALSYNGNLVPAFMNGVLEVMPPEARIYDGFETEGYKNHKPHGYREIQNRMRRTIQQKVQPENWSRARAQMILAPAFYMDAILPKDKTFLWHKFLLPDLEELGPIPFMSWNFAAAMEEAEPYIWFYGEKRAWWKGHNSIKETWEEAPGGAGLTKAICAIKNMTDLESVFGKNLVSDPAFSGTNGAWALWQLEDDRGQPAPGNGTVADGKAVAHKVRYGCFHQNIAVKPGHYYYVVVKGGYAGEGGGNASASLHFLGKDKQWLAANSNLQLNLPRTGQVAVCHGFTRAPEDAAFVSFQCGICGQGETGEIYFTEAYLFEL